MSATSLSPRDTLRKFQRYVDALAPALEHVDRCEPFESYCKGLILPGERKSVEPMAARIAPRSVRATHRSMPHFVATVIEWPTDHDQPIEYWLSTLGERTPLQTLVTTIMRRWRIERDYQELKSELGLAQYEGRSWLGFHHHAALCVTAYGFLLLQQGTFPPHPPAFGYRNLPYPAISSRGALPIRTVRHKSDSIATKRAFLIAALVPTRPHCPVCRTPPGRKALSCSGVYDTVVLTRAPHPVTRSAR